MKSAEIRGADGRKNKKGQCSEGLEHCFLVSKEGTPLGFTWGQRDSSYITHLISDSCCALDF